MDTLTWPKVAVLAVPGTTGDSPRLVSCRAGLHSELPTPQLQPTGVSALAKVLWRHIK